MINHPRPRCSVTQLVWYPSKPFAMEQGTIVTQSKKNAVRCAPFFNIVVQFLGPKVWRLYSKATKGRKQNNKHTKQSICFLTKMFTCSIYHFTSFCWEIENGSWVISQNGIYGNIFNFFCKEYHRSKRNIAPGVFDDHNPPKMRPPVNETIENFDYLPARWDSIFHKGFCCRWDRTTL